MKSKIQKRLASKILKRSKKRIKLDTSRLEDIKEAITRVDIKSLIKDKAIKPMSKKGVSRARANKRKAQKVKGRRRGQGSRGGRKNARLSKKTQWVNKIRLQREFIKTLKKQKKITNETYRELYLKAKGGFFRSKRHMKLYLNERRLIK